MTYANTGMDAEAWFAACRQAEVRALLVMRAKQGKAAVEGYMATVARRRSPAFARGLEEECRQQWRLGNRGAYGDWRVPEPATA